MFLALNGCTTINKVEAPEVTDARPNEKVEPVIINQQYTPHLWSNHKIIDTSVSNCATKGQSILQTLGFNNIVKNGSYVYGNYINNRAAIKCIEVLGVTFVYASVAGPEVKLVERLRNEISWKL